MTSLEIIRTFIKEPLNHILYHSGISKQTWYNVNKSPSRANQATIDKLSIGMNAPYLSVLIHLDILHSYGAIIYNMKLPDTVPDAVAKMIYMFHPVFNNKSNDNRL
jgi:hypothetical protein